MNIIEDITPENIENILREESRYSNDFKELIKRISYINGTNTSFAGVILINYALFFLGNAQDVAINLVNDAVQKIITAEAPNEFDALNSWGEFTRTTIENELDYFRLYNKGTPKEREVVRKMYNKLTGRN